MTSLQGLRATDFFGAFLMQNTTEIELGVIDASKALVIQIKHDDKISEHVPVYFQVRWSYIVLNGYPDYESIPGVRGYSGVPGLSGV